MKVLIISHSCVVGLNQQLYIELAKYWDVDLRIITPRFWREHVTRRKMPFEQDSPLKTSAILGDTVFAGGCTKHFYRNSFLKPFVKFGPDIVYLDEEPQSLAAFQFFLLSKIFKVRVGFRIVENINRNWPTPFSKTERCLIRYSDYAIASSSEAREVLVKKGRKEPIPIVPFVLDSELFQKMEIKEFKKKLHLNGFVIGYMGVLNESKGILTLVKAISKLQQASPDNNYQFFIVGNGYLKERILSLARELAVEERLIMHERVSHTEVPRYLNCMDVLVLPSITTSTWKEQFGRVLIEAMACGVPVVGSDSGEIPHIIEQTGGGLVFHEKDEEDLAHKLMLLIQNRDLRKRLASKGRESVMKKFTCRSVAEQLHNLFTEALA